MLSQRGSGRNRFDWEIHLPMTKTVIFHADNQVGFSPIIWWHPFFHRNQAHGINIAVDPSITQEDEVTDEVGSENRILQVLESLLDVQPMIVFLPDVALGAVSRDDFVPMLLVELQPGLDRSLIIFF